MIYIVLRLQYINYKNNHKFDIMYLYHHQNSLHYKYNKALLYKFFSLNYHK